MLRMSVSAFDQQGEPAGCVRFPTLREVNPFCEKLFHKQAQELRKQGSWKARFCGKMLRLPRKDCLVAAPELRASLPSHSPRFRSLLLALVPCWLTSGGVLLVGLLLLGKLTHAYVVVVVEGIMNSGGGTGCILAPRSPQLGSSQVSGPERKREGTYLSPVWKGA